MKKTFLILIAHFFIPVLLFAQPPQKLAKPKIVIGIVVDQMRWDYLYRYSDRYGNNGFKRLMNEGFNCQNTFINYTPTYTAAGHACIYTGSVPSLHGIMGNNWYIRQLKKTIYCTDDSTVQAVGTTSIEGKMSPVNMLATTITDELRIANNMRSKVIGIALKDRGSILPAGHSANAAYWFDNESGGFISSTYYMNELPEWLKKFNAKKLPEQYLQKDWNTLYPINTYLQSTADDKIYESNVPGEDNTFPHITKNITTNKFATFRVTPHGNSYSIDMAKAAIEGEKLGQGPVTDFLALSLSSPDYIGHTFGPNSIEIEDTYLRLDNDMADFLTYLDKKYGKDNYLIFLSADHGVLNVPGFLKENKIPTATKDGGNMRSDLNAFLKKTFQIENGILQISNYQIFLNHEAFKNVNTDSVKQSIMKLLLNYPAISNVIDLQKIETTPLPKKLKTMLVNGYNQQLSGDLQYIFKPQFYDGGDKGTSHGAWNNYDSHIPLLWFGWGIKKGETYRETYMTDIAATLAALLKVQMPSASIGNVIEEVMTK